MRPGILISSILFAAPGALMAQSLSDTHEQTSVPGKSTIIMRPIAYQTPASAKCHPEASKAIACEANQLRKAANARASVENGQEKRLSER